MKPYSEFGFALLLGAMLLAIHFFLGWQVVVLAAGFSALWFAIAMVLLARPPGIPEFVSERPGSDEQFVVRKDVVPRLPLLARLRLALAVSCGCCLLIWLTLSLFAR